MLSARRVRVSVAGDDPSGFGMKQRWYRLAANRHSERAARNELATDMTQLGAGILSLLAQPGSFRADLWDRGDQQLGIGVLRRFHHALDIPCLGDRRAIQHDN